MIKSVFQTYSGISCMEKSKILLAEYGNFTYTREFDSFIFQKNLTALIKPGFFMSNLRFQYIVFYCNVL